MSGSRVDELDIRSEVEYVHVILDNGTSADRQHKVWEETGEARYFRFFDRGRQEHFVSLDYDKGQRASSLLESLSIRMRPLLETTIF